MGCLTWLLVGLLAGSLAKLIMPGRDPGGCVVTCLIGMVGAVLGGWVGTLIGLGSFDGFDLRSIGLAVLGSLIILVSYRLIFGEPKPKGRKTSGSGGEKRVRGKRVD